MFVSGFTIARNVVKLDYPIKEAILSILPLCDEVVVAVGKSDDNTLEYIKSINSPRIRIVETEWDDTLREGGKVLAAETNKALDALRDETDWAIYIQADECMHEDDLPEIQNAMETYWNDKDVEGLLFNYLHFYGSYNYLADSRSWYRNEIRIIKYSQAIRSYKDAQGFRLNDRKLKVKKIDARVFHYGWVKHPENQQKKLREAQKYWHSDEYINENFQPDVLFDYGNVDSIKLFNQSHPLVMKNRIKSQNWHLELDLNKKNLKLKKRLLYHIEKLTGWRVGEYRNYKEI